MAYTGIASCAATFTTCFGAFQSFPGTPVGTRFSAGAAVHLLLGSFLGSFLLLFRLAAPQIFTSARVGGRRSRGAGAPADSGFSRTVRGGGLAERAATVSRRFKGGVGRRRDRRRGVVFRFPKRACAGLSVQSRLAAMRVTFFGAEVLGVLGVCGEAKVRAPVMTHASVVAWRHVISPAQAAAAPVGAFFFDGQMRAPGSTGARPPWTETSSSRNSSNVWRNRVRGVVRPGRRCVFAWSPAVGRLRGNEKSHRRNGRRDFRGGIVSFDGLRSVAPRSPPGACRYACLVLEL